jgi:formylglycine-generating enzyme required for sulfatase activity
MSLPIIRTAFSLQQHRRAGETYAEVAHETIFRRWGALREWIAAEREFLAWKTALETARRAWHSTPNDAKNEALLMGASLARAQSWRPKRGQDLLAIDREFIDQSTKRESKTRARERHIQALVYVLLIGVIAGLLGWINQAYLTEQWNWYTKMVPYVRVQVRPFVLNPAAERRLQSGDLFRECRTDCPEMIVVPAGEFVMGSPANERDHPPNEEPLHKVVLAKPFAVSVFDVTFADWDACVSVGGCPEVGDSQFGRGTRPVINVSRADAQRYVAWFSKMTDRPYRLLSEAEWEYSARAGTTTTYFWGNEIGKGNGNCVGCDSQWDGRRTAPVGSFAPNAFGLYDMAGNVWKWVQDCYHENYVGAPTDGSAWTISDCGQSVVRGGSWIDGTRSLRSANRNPHASSVRSGHVGFRLGRTLNDR